MQPDSRGQRQTGMDSRPDEELIEAVSGGDQRAFETLIVRYEDAVARFIWRLVPNSSDREEVCQDIFVKSYQKLGQFRRDAKFTTWLFTIAYRTAISFMRKKRLPFEGFDEFGEDVATSMGHEGVIENEQLAELLEAEIGRLAVDDRAVITLYHREGLSIDEIAGILSKPAGTIKSALFRVRKKLKERLEHRLIDEPV